MRGCVSRHFRCMHVMSMVLPSAGQGHNTCAACSECASADAPVWAVTHCPVRLQLLLGSRRGSLGEGVPDAAQAHRQEVDQAGDHGMPNHIAEVEADRIQVIAPVAAVVHPLHLLPSNRCNMAALKTSAHVTNVRHDGNSPQWHQELGFALPTLPDPSQTVPSTALVQALLDLPTVQMPDYAC